ncbi:5'/3'-nucleotidase SurE [Roseimaritima sediminicola]|uniref:5'/3'-nucleotidase SurE n=1 Tax=Roseimaritima sediminicola TaxID=2662066 RepID=UPI0012983D02|nr:5'/3'-nucleotidase SurE [Roseimaritima sediminicola]
MHVLLTNDDGIDAPGLAALQASLQPFRSAGVRVSVVAPDRNQSECGHSVTTRRALRVTELAPSIYTIDGTPVDCVRLALEKIVPDVSLVLSGVNDGGNLGADLLVSGTFAAAKEAYLRGRRAIAISHCRHPDYPRTWEHVPRWLHGLLAPVLDASTGPATAKADKSNEADRADGASLTNINLPAQLDREPETVECAVDPTPFAAHYESLDESTYLYRARYQDRPRLPGRDVAHCFGGRITVSRRFDAW